MLFSIHYLIAPEWGLLTSLVGYLLALCVFFYLAFRLRVYVDKKNNHGLKWIVIVGLCGALCGLSSFYLVRHVHNEGISLLEKWNEEILNNYKYTDRLTLEHDQVSRLLDRLTAYYSSDSDYRAEKILSLIHVIRLHLQQYSHHKLWHVEGDIWVDHFQKIQSLHSDYLHSISHIRIIINWIHYSAISMLLLICGYMLHRYVAILKVLNCGLEAQLLRAEHMERRLTKMLSATRDGVVMSSQQGVILAFNRAAEQMFGYSEAEILGKNISILMGEMHQKEHAHYMDRYLKTGEERFMHVERQLLAKRRQGVLFPVVIYVDYFLLDTEVVFIAFISDISEQDKIQKEKELLQEVTKSVSLAQAAYIRMKSQIVEEEYSYSNKIRQVYGWIIDDIVFYSKSEFGFILGIDWLAKDKAIFEIYSILDVKGDQSRKEFVKNYFQSLMYGEYEIGGLFLEPLQNKKLFLANHLLYQDGFHHYVLPESLRIKHYLVAPIILGADVVGIVVLATEHQPYPQLVVNVLSQYTHMLANMIDSVRDEENRHYILEALASREKRLSLATKSVKMGIWEWEIERDRLAWDDQMYLLYGMDKKTYEQQLTYKLWRETVHPDDITEIERRVSALVNYNEEYDVHFRIVTPQGEEKYIKSSAIVTYDMKKRPYSVVGVNTDVTDFYNTQTNLHQKTQLLLHAEHIAKLGHWRLDMASKKVTMSDETCHILGFSNMLNPECSLVNFMSKLVPEDRPRLEAYLLNASAKSNDFVLTVVILVDPIDHVVRDVEIRGRYEYGSNSQQVVSVFGSIQDIYDRRLIEKELMQHRDNLQRLVDERTVDLVMEKEKAEQAARSKSDFLSNMSHELRTPMHAILNYTHMITKKIDPEKDGKILNYLANIQHSGRRLLGLLNDLLDLSKMEVNKMDYHFFHSDLAVIIDNALMELDSLIRDKAIIIDRVNNVDETATIMDEKRITQVLVNLLGNAIKFSASGGVITISMRAIGYRDALGEPKEGILCEIRDEGIGIPDTELESIFDMFIQSSKSKTGAGGTGLGLAICKTIVTEHQGIVWAGHGDRHGAVMYFTLPYC
jgi:PAS domain S-box-containing protein